VSRIFLRGLGAVSPSGWTVASLREALARGEPLPTKELLRPGWTKPLRVRQVPAPTPRPMFMTHARLRRTSPISHYAVSAALEALSADVECPGGKLRLGVIFCVMSGCVNYSRRFYDEVLKDPATASPLLFPETVYNSPASHLAALLGTTAINYTLVGDPGTFLHGIALAADWLDDVRVDGVLVVGAEEMDWLTADSTRLFSHSAIVSDGAGALYLRREPDQSFNIELRAISNPHLFTRNQTRRQAVRRARAELPDGAQLLCDGLHNTPRMDADEEAVWRDWPGARLSPKQILGEGFMAASAWQCVAALDALRQNQYAAANVSVVGTNEQAIAAQFSRARG